MLSFFEKIPNKITSHFARWFSFKHNHFEVNTYLNAKGIIWVWLAALVWYIFTFNAVPAICFWSLSLSIFLAYHWVRQNALSISATRELKYAAFQVGDLLEEEITLNNNSWLPGLWVQFCDHSSIPGYTVRSVRAVSGWETQQFTSSKLCEQRGVYALGPWEIQMSDPLGIFQVKQVYPEVKEIVVYPPLAPLPDHLLAHHQTRGEHRRLRQALESETINASTTRAYVPGDTLKRVHWPTSARRQQLYIKIFEPESSSRVWLIPDLDSTVQIGLGKDSTLEVTAVLMASLAHQLLEEHLAVGLFARDSIPHVVLPERGKAHLWSILRVAAQLKAVPNQPLIKILQESKTIIRNNDLIILITPSLALDWSNAIVQETKLHGVDVLLYEPHSFGADADAQSLIQWLAHQGISCRLIHKSEIQPLSASYGALRRWEFKVLGTGRVIVRQSPRSAEATTLKF